MVKIKAWDGQEQAVTLVCSEDRVTAMVEHLIQMGYRSIEVQG